MSVASLNKTNRTYEAEQALDEAYKETAVLSNEIEHVQCELQESWGSVKLKERIANLVAQHIVACDKAKKIRHRLGALNESKEQ